MARTAVPVTSINRQTGVAPATPAASDPTNGNTIPNDDHTWLELDNTDAASQTCTVHPAREVDGQAVTGVDHTLEAGAKLRVGPFPVEDYSGQLAVNCTAATLHVAAYRLPVE